mgnify:CR=1 FL=1
MKNDYIETLPRTADAKSWFDSGWQAHRWQTRWDTVYAALYGLLCGVGVAGMLRIWLEL